MKKESRERIIKLLSQRLDNDDSSLSEGTAVAEVVAMLQHDLGKQLEQQREGGEQRATNPTVVEHWRSEAAKIWNKNRHLSVREVASRIDGPTETIRKKIADLKPA